MSQELILKSFPRLREDMLADLPDTLITYLKRGDYTTYRGGDHAYVFRYGDGRLPRLPGTWYVHLFIPDSELEKRVWARLRRFVEELKAARVYAVAGVSFTMWTDDPLPVQLYNLWRIRFVERFLQDNGIRVLPCLDGNIVIMDYVLHTLPRNIPAGSMNVQIEAKHQRKDVAGAMRGFVYTRTMVRVVRPRKVLVCGAEKAQTLVGILAQMGDARPQVVPVQFGKEYREYLAAKRRAILERHHWGGVPAKS